MKELKFLKVIIDFIWYKKPGQSSTINLYDTTMGSEFVYYDVYLNLSLELPVILKNEKILNLDNEYEKYEIFSYCATSRARALGSVGKPVEGINDFNLANFGYGTPDWHHGREFYSSIAEQWDVWVSIKSRLHLPGSP